MATKTKTKLSFSESMARLKDNEQPFSTGALYAFSNMSPEDQARMEAEWSEIAVERQRRISASLAELVEDDIKLDFTEIFMFLLTDPDAQVRGKAIDGLWENESRELLSKLLTIVTDDPADEVREKAALGLSRFAYLASIGKLKERWVQKLHETLINLTGNDKTPYLVARRVVEALGYFSADDRVVKIIERAYNSDDDRVRGSALKAMGRSVNKRWLPEVGKQLTSRTALLRFEAVQAAGEMGSDELTGPVISLTNDTDREVQLAAIWSLGQIGGPEANRVLKEIAGSDDEILVTAANDALAEIVYASNPLNVIG